MSLSLVQCVCIIQEMLQGLCYESCIKLSCHDCHAQWLAFVGKCCRVLSRLLSRSVSSCFSNFGRKFPSGRQLKNNSFEIADLMPRFPISSF